MLQVHAWTNERHRPRGKGIAHCIRHGVVGVSSFVGPGNPDINGVGRKQRGRSGVGEIEGPAPEVLLTERRDVRQQYTAPGNLCFAGLHTIVQHSCF